MSHTSYPYLLFYTKGDYSSQTNAQIQTAFTVSKKKFKRAVDRNKIKRLMRESFRLQKHTLYNNLPKEIQFRLIFVYIGKSIESYSVIETNCNKLLQKLISSETIKVTKQ